MNFTGKGKEGKLALGVAQASRALDGRGEGLATAGCHPAALRPGLPPPRVKAGSSHSSLPTVLCDQQVLLVLPVVRSIQRPSGDFCSIKVNPAKVGEDQPEIGLWRKEIKPASVLQHLLM